MSANIPHAPLRLKLSKEALVSNWSALKIRSSTVNSNADCGAAVKADGYGLGATEVAQLLSKAGCQNFFVAHWEEAAQLSATVPAAQIAVLNGFTASDTQIARATGAIPVLNTPTQIAAWNHAGAGPCHVMLDSGINRLGIGEEQIDSALFAGLDIDLLLSHLASADEDVPQNDAQLNKYKSMLQGITCRRHSLANSAGIMLGHDYHFNLTRPGISLYGGIARPEMDDFIKPVVSIEAQILQCRDLKAGDPVGYNATYKCPSDMRIATIALGYADGYLRGFSNAGYASHNGVKLPVIGRVSMDLVTLDASQATDIKESDWVSIDYDLKSASQQSGLSQYELLTGLGQRSTRIWT